MRRIEKNVKRNLNVDNMVIINNFVSLGIHVFVVISYILFACMNLNYFTMFQKNILFFVLPIFVYCILSVLLLKPIKFCKIITSTMAPALVLLLIEIITLVVCQNNIDLAGSIIYIINPVFSVEPGVGADIGFYFLSALAPSIIMNVALMLKIVCIAIIEKKTNFIFGKNSLNIYANWKKYINLIIIAALIVLSGISAFFYLLNTSIEVTGNEMKKTKEMINSKEYIVWTPGEDYFRSTSIVYANKSTIILDYSDDYYLELINRSGEWVLSRIINYKAFLNNPYYFSSWTSLENEKKELKLPVDFPLTYEERIHSPDKNIKLRHTGDSDYINRITLEKNNIETINIDISPSEISSLSFLDNDTIVQLSISDEAFQLSRKTYSDLKLIFYNINNGTKHEVEIN